MDADSCLLSDFEFPRSIAAETEEEPCVNVPTADGIQRLLHTAANDMKPMQ